MMKQITLLAALLLLASQANAHPGNHMEFNIASIGQHLVSSPYHASLLLIIPLALGIAMVIRKKYRN